jgi:MFS family permease
VLHSGPVGFGGLTSVMAIGSLFAAVGIAYRGRATRRSLMVGASGFSLVLLGVALSHWWLVTLPLLVLLGFFSITFTATANTRLQTVAPPALRGRVMSIYTLLFAGTTPIGSLVVGVLAEHGGVQLAVAEMASVCCLGVIAAFLLIRRMGCILLPEAEIPSPPARGALGATHARS